MNKMLSTLASFGAGMVAFNYVKKHNMFSGRQMKKMSKKMTKALF